MKKLFFSLVAAIVAATATYAQSSLVATLSHNGEISVFHGASSLKQAMKAATHGDIITLASGRYDAADITKAITLRGAGMDEDTISGAFRTHIVGNFNINISDAATEHLTIEGIYHDSWITISGTLNNTMFQKSQFRYIRTDKDDNTINSFTCIHCYIFSDIVFPNKTSATFINCVVSAPQNPNGGTMEFSNCIILGNIAGIRNSSLTNCLIKVDYSTLNETNMASYCAGYSQGQSVFYWINKQTNKRLKQFDALFKAGTFYELTDEAKQEYVGNDGKELGIHGGNLPWDSHILTPQITKCNVAAKTTADGKLSVDIEVKAAE